MLFKNALTILKKVLFKVSTTFVTQEGEKDVEENEE